MYAYLFYLYLFLQNNSDCKTVLITLPNLNLQILFLHFLYFNKVNSIQ